MGSSVQSVSGCVGCILGFPYVVGTAEDRLGAERHVYPSAQKQPGGSGIVKGGFKEKGGWNVDGSFDKIGLRPTPPFDSSAECTCEGLLGFQLACGCIFNGRVWPLCDFRFISVMDIGRCSKIPRLNR